VRNIRLTIAYDGTDFHGWQRQPSSSTIQAVMESALAQVIGVETTVYGSGRTDAGVHAANQVANFKTTSPIPCANLVKALNNLLPVSIRVKQASDADLTFHARYSARAKTYRYRFLLAPVASPFIARFVYHYPYPLDEERMAEAAAVLQGEHDFTSFAAADPHNAEAESGAAGKPSERIRTLTSSRILSRPRASILIYEAHGNGFLHHMVRNIAGTLIEVGNGKLTARRVREILAARDRTLAGPTAPAQGLCLWKVEY
jgi:tRNA pseudouridine38-40 synthase